MDFPLGFLSVFKATSLSSSKCFFACVSQITPPSGDQAAQMDANSAFEPIIEQSTIDVVLGL